MHKSVRARAPTATLGGRLRVAAAALACAALAIALLRPSAPATVAGATRPRTQAAVTRGLPETPPAAFAATATPPPSAWTAGVDAQRMYAIAMQYDACRQRAQAPPPSAVLPPGIDEMDRAAAAAQRDAERQRRDACAGIGRAQYAQIDTILRSAAAQGDADAQRSLLARRIRSLLDRAGAGQRPGERIALSAADVREAEAVVAELETLALRGDRPSIEELAQVLESPIPAIADPAYAAAWRLAARQAPGQPFPPSERLLGGEELLDALDPAQRQQALALAPDLYAQCCARR
ncbi:hypothetical protein [Xanthomonas bonasiae]|uniref:hypothetical protein n=1 Tax=Xanthomonas bonasiae TaxID=2810351 RepID=UPI00177D84D2|nr:hypothetical protein [Xanthomonas surreyensis]MBD7923425.1 hypothetical protein [Xanthomonas surreyensis]